MRRTALVLASVLAIACTESRVSVKPPMMGWASWNAFMIDISDTLIMQQADLLVSTGLASSGYKYVNIDDGHFGFRDAYGNMTPNPIRFPGGLRQVTDHIHSLGLKAGIYSDAGDNTCGSGYNKDPYGMGAGLWGHEIQDAQTYFNDWGFDYIKIDFCGGNHLKLDTEERYLQIRRVIDSVAVHPVIINACRWHYPGTWIPQAADSWRISGDIFPEWRSVKYVMDKNMYLSAYTGGGKYNDMDMLVVGYGNKASGLLRGNGLSFSEEEAHFGLWCIMSSPLMLGFDLAYLPEDTRILITNPELLAINQDKLGIQPQVVWHEGEGYVLAKDLGSLRGTERAVALYNPSDEALLFELPLETLGYSGSVEVRDLIRREDLGRSGNLRLEVPAHYAKILRLKGAERVEPSVYEAEWGYIPAYNDINLGGAKYVKAEGASCNAAVEGLGGSEENSLQWRSIYRRRGGMCTLSVNYRSAEPCEVVLKVNGVPQTVQLAAAEGFAEVEVKAAMKKGDNEIEISSPAAVIPALIDCIRIDNN